MVSKEYIYEKIIKNIECIACFVEDVSDGAPKFKATIVSEGFVGKSLIQRHRMIYQIFEEELKGPIHALSLSTLTSSQYSQNN